VTRPPTPLIDVAGSLEELRYALDERADRQAARPSPGPGEPGGDRWNHGSLRKILNIRLNGRGFHLTASLAPGLRSRRGDGGLRLPA
jgi:hypothetical protein